jgi:hypothetical protein
MTKKGKVGPVELDLLDVQGLCIWYMSILLEEAWPEEMTADLPAGGREVWHFHVHGAVRKLTSAALRKRKATGDKIAMWNLTPRDVKALYFYLLRRLGPPIIDSWPIEEKFRNHAFRIMILLWVRDSKSPGRWAMSYAEAIDLLERHNGLPSSERNKRSGDAIALAKEIKREVEGEFQRQSAEGRALPLVVIDVVRRLRPKLPEKKS